MAMKTEQSNKQSGNQQSSAKQAATLAATRANNIVADMPKANRSLIRVLNMSMGKFLCLKGPNGRIIMARKEMDQQSAEILEAMVRAGAVGSNGVFGSKANLTKIDMHRSRIGERVLCNGTLAGQVTIGDDCTIQDDVLVKDTQLGNAVLVEEGKEVAGMKLRTQVVNSSVQDGVTIGTAATISGVHVISDVAKNAILSQPKANRKAPQGRVLSASL